MPVGVTGNTYTGLRVGVGGGGRKGEQVRHRCQEGWHRRSVARKTAEDAHFGCFCVGDNTSQQALGVSAAHKRA
jgi:hypothetical protein